MTHKTGTRGQGLDGASSLGSTSDRRGAHSLLRWLARWLADTRLRGQEGQRDSSMDETG